jgi:hypothetical protein
MVTIWILPATVSGVSSLKSLIADTIPGYSAPWIPAVMVTVGPGFAPSIVARGKAISSWSLALNFNHSVFLQDIYIPLICLLDCCDEKESEKNRLNLDSSGEGVRKLSVIKTAVDIKIMEKMVPLPKGCLRASQTIVIVLAESTQAKGKFSSTPFSPLIDSRVFTVALFLFDVNFF